MNDFAKGNVVVLGPDEGELFWQPLPSVGYITSKLTPYNTPYDGFSMGIQVLEPGAHVRRHGHERQHEVLFCYEGEGWAEIGDQRYEMRPETMILIGRGVMHKIQNTGTGPDAHAVDDRAGGAGGLVPRHRPSSPARRANARAVRAPIGCRRNSGAAEVYPVGGGVSAVSGSRCAAVTV